MCLPVPRNPKSKIENRNLTPAEVSMLYPRRPFFAPLSASSSCSVLAIWSAPTSAAEIFPSADAPVAAGWDRPLADGPAR